MRFVSWNVGANSGYSWDACRRYLDEELHAEVALLQEVPLDGDDFIASARCAKTWWGSAIRTTLDWKPFVLPVPDELAPWLRIAAATLETPTVDLLVASVHPNFGDAEWARASFGPLAKHQLPGARYIWHCDLAYGILREALPEDARFIVGGDWNTARAFQDTSVADAAVSMAFFDRALAQGGWHDVVYNLAVEGKEVATYRKGRTPYQLDHLFADLDTANASSNVAVRADALDLGLSDHAPIVMDCAV